MTKDEKLSKVVRDFSVLPEEKQDYVLGIVQALAFAVGERDEAACAEARRKETGENEGFYIG